MQIVNFNIVAMFSIFIEYCVFSKPLSTVQTESCYFF